ncbi:hypothetical protein SAMN05443572_10351 [Myxococcus fulvus]|uniref:Carbohydrate-binding module family 96 domain-containing protein n=1 Tax=Myxococcus fulvus TaxID=33 RepID=A0A511TGP2_MYXFU|nr:DNRLRE domain-containing protein [Myxococcus fulvus]GEN12368.1 hypothetical protein MFU01_74050 [Myxococcus fulvus]SET74911.1 hypothetical protein SAMN05443572_10351 [Myxococcus fulvus]
MALFFLNGCGSAQPGAEVDPETGSHEQQLVTQTVAIVAAADTYVSAASPATSFGSQPTMEVDRSPESEAYLRFYVAPVDGTITTARLRVYALDGSADGPTAHDPRIGGRAWNELTTWNTRPTRDGFSALSSAGAVASGTWIELDITEMHISTSAFTDVHLVADSTDGVTIASSEHPNTSLRPQLVLTVQSADDHPPHPALPITVSSPPVVFTASDDTYVSADAPTSTEGGFATDLRVGQSPDREVHLRFDVLGLTESVQRAVLRMYVGLDGTAGGPAVYATQGPWSEMSVSWNTRPTKVGAEVDRLPYLAPSGYVDYEVTDLVRGNGNFTFGVYGTSGDALIFRAKENWEGAGPQLLVWTGAPRAAPTDACMTRQELVSKVSELRHDTYVSAERPTTTFHREASMRVDGSPGMNGFLEFDVQLDATPVRRVLLQLYALEATDNGPLLYKSQPFDPATATWQNPPAMTDLVGDAGAVKKDQWVEYDVTSVVTASGRYAFGLLADSSKGLSFATGDASAKGLLDAAPRLVVVTESAPFCSYRGTRPSGTTAWVKQTNNASAERARDTAPAPDGGFAVVGTQAQARDGEYWAEQTDVVTLHRADGSVAWRLTFAQPDVEFRKVTVTALGNVLVAGEYRGTPDLGKGALPRGTGMFVMKLTPSGAVDWTRGYTAWFRMDDELLDNPMFVHDLATDAHGSAVVTGGFWGKTDFGGGEVDAGKPFPYDDEYPNSFVLKLQWDGAYQWARVLKTNAMRGTQAVSVAVDAQENITVGGWAGPGTDFGAGALAQGGVFVARWNVTGDYLWHWLLPTSYDTVFADVRQVAALPDGGVAFTGDFDGRFTFAGSPYASAEPDDGYDGPREPFLGRLTSTGTELTLRHFPMGTGIYFSGLNSLTADANGNLFTVQSGHGGLLGLGTVGLPETVAPERPTVASFSSTLQTRWVRVFEPLQSPRLTAVTGGVVLTGDLGRSIELEGTWYTPTSRRLDLLHVKLRP